MEPEAEVVLLLPPVEVDRLDTVLHAAGHRYASALAVLVSAIGWLIVHGGRRADRAVTLRGVQQQIARAVALHEIARGQG